MKTFLLLNTKIEGRWQKQHEFPHLQNIGIVFVFLHSASVERKKKVKISPLIFTTEYSF